MTANPNARPAPRRRSLYPVTQVRCVGSVGAGGLDAYSTVLPSVDREAAQRMDDVLSA